MSKQSKQYLAKLRLRRFEQIFEYVSEHQGAGDAVSASDLLSPQNPIMDSMEGEVRDDVLAACRLFCERAGALAPNGGWKKSRDVRMSAAQFVEALADAIDAAPGHRTYLEPVTRVRAVDENMTFKPKLCQQSLELAKSSRPDGQSVFDALTAFGENAQRKKQQVSRAAGAGLSPPGGGPR